MQLSYTVNNISLFSAWLKRFSSIDKSLLLEIDLSSSEFIAKTYNEEHSVVKFSSVGFNDVGFELTTKKVPESRIHVGVYDVLKIIKTFTQFTENFDFIVKYDEILDNKNTKYIGKQLLLKNDMLKVGFDCTSLSIFKYLSDDVFHNTICKIEPLLNFDLKEEDLNKIMSLSDLDKEYKKLEFKAQNKKITARSKSFELTLGICNGQNLKLPILKDQLDKVDSENYQIVLGDRMILTSTDSPTTTVISSLDLNEYDTDKDVEL